MRSTHDFARQEEATGELAFSIGDTVQITRSPDPRDHYRNRFLIGKSAVGRIGTIVNTDPNAILPRGDRLTYVVEIVVSGTPVFRSWVHTSNIVLSFPLDLEGYPLPPEPQATA